MTRKPKVMAQPSPASVERRRSESGQQGMMIFMDLKAGEKFRFANRSEVHTKLPGWTWRRESDRSVKSAPPLAFVVRVRTGTNEGGKDG